MKPDALKIRNFGPIGEASIKFGDLTILVGAQGTGKSLALQWLKAVLDGGVIVSELKKAGDDVSKPETLIELIFGVGMGAAWREDTTISFNGSDVLPAHLGRRGPGEEKVFFIPAHRALLISDGWAAPFQKLTAETPVVARLFSQMLYKQFDGGEDGRLFPLDRVLKKEYRDLVDAAVFHHGQVSLELDQLHRRRLKLTYGTAQLPFMAWTAGQREFTPLMLGLYHLLPPRAAERKGSIKWVVIEEPEMGLHPRAVTVFMLLVLELLKRGYRVVLSTHSPLVLTIAWTLRRLQVTKARWQLLCDAFDVGYVGGMKEVAQAALQKDLRVYSFAFAGDDENSRVYSKDVSSLDPASEDDDVSGWGGLTSFDSHFSDVVRRAANEQEAA